MSDKSFNFQEFLNESIKALTKPADYFASMPVSGGFAEPVIKAVIYGTVAGIISMVWGIAGLSIGSGMLGGMLGGGTVGFMILVWSFIGALIGLFVGGVIILIISAISGGNTDYEASVRISASLMVLSPISAALGFAGGIHYSLGAIISLLLSLYGLFMLYQALVKNLKAKEGTAKIITIILAAIPVLMLLSALVCAKAIQSGSDKWIKQSEKLIQKLEKGGTTQDMKKMNDALDKLKKASEKAGK